MSLGDFPLKNKPSIGRPDMSANQMLFFWREISWTLISENSDVTIYSIFFLHMQYDGNLNQSLKMPRHSLFGSNANNRCNLENQNKSNNN